MNLIHVLAYVGLSPEYSDNSFFELLAADLHLVSKAVVVAISSLAVAVHAGPFQSPCHLGTSRPAGLLVVLLVVLLVGLLVGKHMPWPSQLEPPQPPPSHQPS